MRREGNLFPRVTDFENLYQAFRMAFRGTSRTVESLSFLYHLEGELHALRDELRGGRYRPGPYRYFTIQDPKERVIAVAPFRDRVVHHAIVRVIEPLYEKKFIFDSYATRKGKGTHRAILRAQHFLRRKTWFLKADVRKYFDSVDHGRLTALLERALKDGELLALLHVIIENGGLSGRGLPIGNLTSQFLANVYLDPFDHYVKEELGVRCYLRYMDDFVLFDDDRERLKELRGTLEEYLRERLGLALKERSVIINQQLHGLSFLGMRIFPRLIRLKKENLRRCMRKLHERLREWERGTITEERLRMSLTSITGHMAGANSTQLRKDILWGAHR